MLTTCPYCQNTFDSSSTASTSSSAPRCCAAAQPTPTVSPCVRVFSDSGGGLVVTATPSFDKPPNIFPPQPSPSVQLSFFLPSSTPWFPFSNPVTPPPPPPPQPTHPPTQNLPPYSYLDSDLVRLSNTQRSLRASGWYYEGFSWQESAAALEQCSPGTFLVRDSSDPRFLFSLSVQTGRGPTSVRLHYSGGQFRLDAEEHLVRYIPVFDCVLRLVEHYISLGSQRRDHENSKIVTFIRGRENKEHVWVDDRGHMYSPILLTQPKRRTVPSLQHLARLCINKSLERPEARDSLNIPPALEAYLRDYPYTQ